MYKESKETNQGIRQSYNTTTEIWSMELGIMGVERTVKRPCANVVGILKQ